jgi:signal transduction histidine kinase
LQAKKEKRYINPLKGKAKVLAIVSIVLIIAISYGLFFYLENTTEQNIRHSIIQQQVQNQLKDIQALSRHIGTDLTLVADNLHGLANSIYIQQGDLSSNTTRKLAEDTYARLNSRDNIIDRLVIADKTGFETIGLAAKGQKSFAGTDISSRPWVHETLKSRAPTFSNGFVGLDGNYRIAIGYPITNLKTGQYMGLIGALVPFETFLSQYGNVHNPNSKYLVAYDKNATILATAVSNTLIGKNFFGDYAQQFIKHNKLLTDFVRNLLTGRSSYAIYNYGYGERLSTGYPIYVNGKAAYFVRIVAPTAEIYSHINDVLFAERVKMFSLIAGTTAAIAILIVFLIKWSGLNEEVKRRGKELEEANEELKSANKQLSSANEQLKVHDKMQKEFINVASHEIKTPTQAILGFSELLQRHPENREQISQALLRNASRLQRLTNDILDVTRIESHTLKPNKEKFNLTELISSIVEDFKNDIQKKGNSVALLYEPEENLVVEADKGRITQVISNLLSNAIKFTKEGSISISVAKKRRNEDVKNSQGYEEVVVSVKDTGIGIDLEMLPRLFTKFATKSELTGGTGLGLFISKSIIEAHGGKMWADNNNNVINDVEKRGATFYFTLSLVTNKIQSDSNENGNAISRQLSKR